LIFSFFNFINQLQCDSDLLNFDVCNLDDVGSIVGGTPSNNTHVGGDDANRGETPKRR
jgi:hypothetical protein